MKKRLISLVAAAALVGGMATVAPSVASAGTVTVKGDTQVQIYGRLKTMGAWSEKTNGLNSNLAFDIKKATGTTWAGQKAWDKWNWNGFRMSGSGTALGLKFSNKDANLSGMFEMGLPTGANGVYLRHAYVQHNFDNGLYVLVGQTNNTFEVHTFNALPEATAGFNKPARSPQVAVGGKFDIADSANLDFKFAFLDQDYIGGGQLNRRVSPTIGLNVGVNFNTGFGAPARVYANGLVERAKVTVDGGITEDSKTSDAFGIGFVVPVSMVTVQSEYIYAKGMMDLAGLKLNGAAPAVLTSYDRNGDANKWYGWNLEAKVAPMPCTSVAAGYDYMKIKDQSFKNKTFFVNAAVKTTKYTTLTIEWDHMKTNWSGDNHKGNTIFTSYSYAF